MNGPTEMGAGGSMGYGIKDSRDIFNYNSSYQLVTAKQIKSHKQNNHLLKENLKYIKAEIMK